MRALPIEVYRGANGYDCTNGGISSRFKELLLICEDGWMEIDEENPPENLVKAVVKKYSFATTVHIEPYVNPTGCGWMFGGNFAYTSDSRFRDTFGWSVDAVSIHDRQESQELNRILSF